MDWEANLAAIIKHTDANLKQQFRQFEEISGDLGTYSQHGAFGSTGPESGAFGAGHKQPPPDSSANNFATTFLRDTMATLRGGNSMSATGSGGGAPPASFAQHFRERQERKRYEHPHENNRPATEDGESDQEEQHQSSRRHRSRNSTKNGGSGGMGFHMYSSQTYDMAQMMEQVRLSLKLEIDARASIAERQLSALLQLCKASSEELDRLRVEVCAADRQLHTLDQIQAKMRQELTTQKDISFHLQSMCGKDESWRMQAENQLLELRQMVAAIREQGNSVQMQVQDKLSRQDLLVQFNAAIEPIKAQFQATLQHQAHQLAEMTRSSSSSSLLLDALTQKVNRVQSDEIAALRNDLQALKIHMSRMGSFDRRGDLNTEEEDADEDAVEGDTATRTSRRSIITRRAKEKETDLKRERIEHEREQKERLRDEALKKLIMGELMPHAVLPLIKSELDRTMEAPLSEVKVSVGRELGQVKQDLHALSRLVQESETTSQRRADAVAVDINSQLKQLEQLLKGDVAAQLRDTRDRSDLQIREVATQLTSLLDSRVVAIHSKHNDVVKVMESEQKDRKAANEALQEELRKARHALEEQVHMLSCETRSRATTLTEEWSQKLREAERKWHEIVESNTKQQTQVVDATWTKTASEVNGRLEMVETRTRGVEELAGKLERSMQEMLVTVAKTNASRDAANTDGGSESRETRRSSLSGASFNGETQAQVQLAAMDSLLQKMMLQMQLQMQQQHQQAQLAIVPASMYPPHYWSAPPPPTAPPTSITSSEVQTPVTVSPASNATTTAPTSVATPPTMEKELANSVTQRTEVSTMRELAAKGLPPPPPTSTKQEPEKPAKLAEDPKIDDIISRAIAEELTPLTTVNRSASPPKKEETSISKSDINRTEEEVAPPAPQPTPSSLMTPPQPLSPPSVVIVANDSSTKVQLTLASTAKGAITEAEMAKLRIEARRKQEQDARMQNGVSPKAASASTPQPSTLTRSSSTSSLLPSSQPPTPSNGFVAENKAAPPLIRSNSTNSLLPATTPAVPTPATSQPNRPPAITTVESRSPPSGAPSKPPPPNQSSATSSSTAPSTVAIPPPTPPIPRPGTGPSDVKESTMFPVEPRPLATKPPPPHPTAQATVNPAVRTPPPTTGLPSASPPQPSVTHTLCEQCRLPVRSDLLNEHMQRQCIKRTIACAKCQVKFPWHEVEPHQRDCQGAQPSSTSTAKPIPTPQPSPAPTVAPPAPTFSSPDSVAGDSSSALGASQLKKCRHCTADVATTELFEHELRCDQMLKQCPHCLRRQKVSELQDHIENCDCRLVPCPNDCGGKFLQRGIDKHITTRCPKRSSGGASSPPKLTGSASNGPAIAPPQPPTPAPVPTPSGTPSAATSSLTTTPSTSEKMECKFCDEEFSAKEIDAHENNCDWKPKRCQHCNMVIISRDLIRHESSCKTSSKNCPHCNDTMPQSALPGHTSRCSKRPIKCIRCCQLFPADSIVAHSSSCKFIPSSTTAGSSTASATASVGATANASVRIPPPPPYPPTSAATGTTGSRPATPSSVPPPPSGSRPSTPGQNPVASAPTPPPAKPPTTTASTTLDQTSNVEDRLARRNLALSQLTGQAAPAMAVSQPGRPAVATPAGSVVSVRVPTQPQVEDDEDEEEEDDDEDEEDDDGDDDDDDDDQLTLAQVVSEWSVENVCLWLHEDVGVPEVVPRFQQRRCNGEILLELTESDLINDYGIKNRVHRERILSAIDAIKTSDDFSDDEEEEEEEEEGEEEEEEDDAEDDHHSSAMAGGRLLQTPQQRGSMSRLSLSEVASPRDLLRRNSLPSPQDSPVRIAGAPPSTSSTLPSSSAMLRRINSALNVEFPPSTRSNK